MRSERVMDQLEEMICHFCNFYEMEKKNPDKAWREGPQTKWKENIFDIFFRQPEITLRDLREKHLLVYRMKDRAIVDMIKRLRKGRKTNEGETMVKVEGADGEETVLQSKFPVAELETLENELARRKKMEKLFHERERMLREGILIFGVQGKIVRAWKELYEEVAIAIKGNVVTMEDIRKDPSLVKKMKNKAITDMTFRMRKKTKKAFLIADAIGTLKEGTKWEDVAEGGYWVLVSELDERRKLHRMKTEAARIKKLEEEDGEDTGGRLKEDFGHDEDDEDEMVLSGEF